MRAILLGAAIGVGLALSASVQAAAIINGAGATFPYPLYSKWFAEFQKSDPSVQINYQSVGSGGGIRQFLEKTVDFGASDAPMTDEQLGKAAGPVLHIPTVLGAVVVTYNLPEAKQPLKLTPDLVAGIFLGTVTTWNDPKLVAVNPWAKDLKGEILVVHRSDGSGTTSIFTDYLTRVSTDWKSKVGAGTSVNWPTGLGGKGNEGVAGLVKQTPGSLGYVELIYATNNGLPVAPIANKAKVFAEPTTKSVTAAAAGALKQMPADFRISITDAAGKDAYPISGFTYLLINQQLPKEKGEKLVRFLKWAMGPGQGLAEPLGYAPLPKELIKKVEKRIGEITLK